MKSIIKIALGIIVAVVLLAGGCAAIVGSAMSGSDSDNTTAADRAAQDRKDRKSEDSSPSETTETKTEKAEPEMTAGQKNALAAAENYLQFQAFSKTGLIKQLKFEKYPEKDAVFAVNNLDVDWKEQAALAAENYLSMQAFSREGLIQQLKFEGYTQAEAEYGVKQAGL